MRPRFRGEIRARPRRFETPRLLSPVVAGANRCPNQTSGFLGFPRKKRPAAGPAPAGSQKPVATLFPAQPPNFTPAGKNVRQTCARRLDASGTPAGGRLFSQLLPRLPPRRVIRFVRPCVRSAVVVCIPALFFINLHQANRESSRSLSSDCSLERLLTSCSAGLSVF